MGLNQPTLIKSKLVLTPIMPSLFRFITTLISTFNFIMTMDLKDPTLSFIYETKLHFDNNVKQVCHFILQISF